MKRIAAFLVALLLVATCTVYVSAAGTTAVMSSATAEVGDIVVLTITLANAPKTEYMVFGLEVPAGIKLVSNVVPNPDYNADDPECEEEEEIDQTRWTKSSNFVAVVTVEDNVGAWTNQTKKSVDGKVLSLAFKVEDTAACGENEIEFYFWVDDSAERDANVTETAGVITIPHDFEEELTNDDADGHYYACKGCDEKKGFEEHGFDMSCDETCDECGYTRTEVEHDFSETLVKDDPEGHYYKCACGAKTAEAAHEYTYDCDAECNVCGYVRTGTQHTPAAEASKDATGHWFECVCGEQIAKVPHVYDFDCDTECNICKWTREASHTYSETYVNTDSAKHWKACECGDKIEEADHVYDYDCDTECNVCKHVREANHTYSEIYVNTDSAKHWKECECGAKSEEATHDYDFECDTICDTCEYVREATHDFSIVRINEEEHWKVCSFGCETEDGRAAHTYDKEVANEEYLIDPTNCQHGAIYAKSCECGYRDWSQTNTFVVGEADPDAHAYIYDYETDTAECTNEGCDSVIGEEDGLKGEATDKIEGNGASITTDEEGVLGENMSVATEDAMEVIVGDSDTDLGEFTEELEGYKAVECNFYYVQVGDAFAPVTAGMKLTVKIPTTDEFTDIKLYVGDEGDELFDYVDNGDGTVTITIDEELANNLGAVPVLFVGKPVAGNGGDNGHIALWIAVLAISVLGLVATAYYSKKKATK